MNTSNLSRGRKLGHPRSHEVEARAKAFAGARMALANNLSMTEAADRSGSKVSSVQEVVTVLRFGTEEEIRATEACEIGPRTICDHIRRRVPPEVMKAQVRRPVATTTTQGVRLMESDLWGRLRNALETINGMPAAADMAAIVKKNTQRADHVNRNLLNAHTWLEDFVNAWTK